VFNLLKISDKKAPLNTITTTVLLNKPFKQSSRCIAKKKAA